MTLLAKIAPNPKSSQSTKAFKDVYKVELDTNNRECDPNYIENFGLEVEFRRPEYYTN